MLFALMRLIWVKSQQNTHHFNKLSTHYLNGNRKGTLTTTEKEVKNSSNNLISKVIFNIFYHFVF